MTQLETTCLLYENHIRAFRAFAATYPEVLDERALAVLSDRPFLLLHDAALAGKVLGTEGWTRKRNPYRTSGIAYDWTRTILGITVKIEDAETQDDMDKTPVSPKAFPLALEEASPSFVEEASSPETEEEKEDKERQVAMNDAMEEWMNRKLAIDEDEEDDILF